MRRRERRLRSAWRHEQLSVAVALAAAAHHSAQPNAALRGQKPGTRAKEGEVREEHQALRGQTRLPPGMRPARLVGVQPQGHVKRHFAEHLAELAPLVQILDAPVPQLVDNVMDAFRFLDQPMTEQVIEVPRISCPPCPSRSQVPVPLTAEQLVEVPTVLSPTRIALQIAEQIVGIPVPHGRGERHVHGFLPGQSSTAFPSAERISEQIVERIVDIPSGGLQGFSPGQGTTAFSSAERISERTAEQSVDIPGGGLQGFSPGQVSTPFSSAKRLSERTAEHIVDIPGGGLHAVQGFLPGSSSTADIPPQPVPDPWWESLTPALQAEIEEARAQVRREQRSKRTRKKKRKKKAPRSSSYSSLGRARRRHRQWHVLTGFLFRCFPRCVPVDRRQASPSGSFGWFAYVLCWFYWWRCTSRYVPFWRRQAQDAPHPGRYGPEGLLQWHLHGWFCL